MDATPVDTQAASGAWAAYMTRCALWQYAVVSIHAGHVTAGIARGYAKLNWALVAEGEGVC